MPGQKKAKILLKHPPTLRIYKVVVILIVNQKSFIASWVVKKHSGYLLYIGDEILPSYIPGLFHDSFAIK